MSKRSRHLEPRQVIQAYRETYGDGVDAPPSDISQVLSLGKARLAALALLLKVDPEQLQCNLDDLIRRADLSEATLNEARGLLKIPNRKTLGELLEGVSEASLRDLQEGASEDFGPSQG